MAVIDLIAAAVGGVEQRLVPIGEEQARQRVREMVVGEEQPRVGPQPEIGEEGAGVEHLVGAAPELADDDIHLARLLVAGEAAQPFAQPFVRPPIGEIAPAEEAAGADQHVDVARSTPAMRRTSASDGLGKTARALDPVEPLLGDGGNDACSRRTARPTNRAAPNAGSGSASGNYSIVIRAVARDDRMIDEIQASGAAALRSRMRRCRLLTVIPVSRSSCMKRRWPIG